MFAIVAGKSLGGKPKARAKKCDCGASEVSERFLSDALPMNNPPGKERGLEMAKKNEKMKRVLLAMFFFLLISSTANAQSPRVLWEQVQVMEIKEGTLSENSQWTLLKAAPTPEQCREAQRQAFEVRKNEYTVLKGSKPWIEIFTNPYKSITIRSSLEPTLISNIFECLPEKTDPRKR